MTYKMFLDKAEQYFFGSYHFKRQAGLFRKLLYILIVVKCLYWLIYFDLLFSNNSLVYIRPYQSGSLDDLAFLLCNHGSAGLNLFFIIFSGTLSLVLLFTRSTYIAELVLWFMIVNLHNRIYSTLSGGDHLLVQFLFFNSFLCYPSVSPGIKAILHNFAVLAIITQVCIVYVLAAAAKLGDGSWLGGNAVSEIVAVNHFSTGNNLQWPQPVYIFLNYFVILYQLLFPVFALLKRTKLVFLTCGIAMHLYIAFVTGLPGFAAVMLLAYVFFWPLNTADPEN